MLYCALFFFFSSEREETGDLALFTRSLRRPQSIIALRFFAADMVRLYGFCGMRTAVIVRRTWWLLALAVLLSE